MVRDGPNQFVLIFSLNHNARPYALFWDYHIEQQVLMSIIPITSPELRSNTAVIIRLQTA